jgi:hypothetical protein
LIIIIIISTNHPNSNHYCIPGVIEGVQRALSSAALVVLKKKGIAATNLLYHHLLMTMRLIL